MHQYCVLSIAGSDPSCGAGIQADLKTFSALGVYGTTVITSLIAQNTKGVQQIYPVDACCVTKQLDSIFSDIVIDSVKIGLLGQTSVIYTIVETLKNYSVPFIILDTVMIAKSGDALLSVEAINTMRDILLPLVSIITPNLLEAAVLLKCSPAENEYQMRQQGYNLLKLGCNAVIMKGGHLSSNICPDWLITNEYEFCFKTARVFTNNTHGLGCTLSAALTALRPRYNNWIETLKIAKIWLQKTLLHANELHIGKGNGPVHHFYEWW